METINDLIARVFDSRAKKFEKNKYISGEYLTYTCVDKEKMLIKK